MHALLERWAYFVVGGALFTPYALFLLLAVPLIEPADWVTRHEAAHNVGLLVLLIAATSLVPVVRTIEGQVVPPLLSSFEQRVEFLDRVHDWHGDAMVAGGARLINHGDAGGLNACQGDVAVVRPWT